MGQLCTLLKRFTVNFLRLDPLPKPLTLEVVAIAPRDSAHYWFGRYGYGWHGYEDDSETPNPPVGWGNNNFFQYASYI